MTVPGGGYIRATAVQSFGVSASVMNVFDFLCQGVGPWDEADVMQVLEVHLSSIYTHMSPFIMSVLAPVEIRAFNVTSNQPMPTYPWTTWAGGTGAQQPLPYGVSMLLLLRTNRPRVLGRKFIGGLGEGNCSGDAFDAASMAACAAFANNLMTDYTDVGLGLTLAYRVVDRFGGHNPAIEAVVSSNPAYQRRRRAGRGV